MKASSPEDYTAAIARLRERMTQWRQSNPTTTAQIVFPTKIMVIGEIYLALEAGFVKCNDAGYEMLKAMCGPEKDQPTVLMVRLAIEGEEAVTSED